MNPNNTQETLTQVLDKSGLFREPLKFTNLTDMTMKLVEAQAHIDHKVAWWIVFKIEKDGTIIFGGGSD